jgi:hypothetical protein
MKKLVVALVVLVAICVLAPFGIGKLAEKRVNTGLDKLVEQAPYFKIAKREWKSGWFKSEQVVTVELSEAWAKAMVPAEAGKALEKALGDEAAAGDAAMDAEFPGWVWRASIPWSICPKRSARKSPRSSERSRR